MFIGHYGIAFALKSKFSRIPLWSLFVAVQLADILAFALVIFGVERVAYNPDPNPFLRTTLQYLPYTHSLTGNLLIALTVFAIVARLKDKTWAFALSIAVLSHWFLDALVHVGDLPIVFDRFKVGLGLWRLPRTALAAEIALLILSACYMLKGAPRKKRCIIVVALLCASYIAIFFAPQAEATPTQAAVMSLTLYAIFTALAFWTDRQTTSTARPTQ